MDSLHPDRNALDRYSRGEAPAFEERFIEDHLRSGCGRCQREVDDILLRTLTPASSPDEEEVWRRLIALTDRRLAEVAAERREAPALLAELLARPPGEQPALVRMHGRLSNVAVCELLIERSFEEGRRDSSRSLEMAELALLVAESLEEDRYGRSVVQDFRARAWAFLGNARRIARDLAGAEEALDLAERLLEEGSADPMEEARVLDLRASLLADQGRFEQAVMLLDMVIDIYDDLREPHHKGLAMIGKGQLLGCCGWPEEALRLIRKGLSLVDWDREPSLVLAARHDVARLLKDRGRGEEARRPFQRYRYVSRELRDS